MTTREAVEKWKNDVYNKGNEIDPCANYHWESLAVGFFMGLGFTHDDAFNIYWKICMKENCF